MKGVLLCKSFTLSRNWLAPRGAVLLESARPQMPNQQKYRKYKGMTNSGVFGSICPLHTSLDRYQHDKGEASVMGSQCRKEWDGCLTHASAGKGPCVGTGEGQSAQRGKAARKLMHWEPKAGLGMLLRNKKMLLVFLLFPGKGGPGLWSLTSWIFFLRLYEAPLPVTAED